ncbi:hypothetical protein [Bacillus thuringiensis]|uniref:hypothetical protein n=1 Tax=Bacillus thuringiensis TaxID=1428 RepID=UPI0024BD5B15|nr:hypothetical protein [Bacillus thuringiensis]
MGITIHSSIARSSRLKCGDCKDRIQKGDHVLFYLENGKFHNVLCTKCDHGKSELLALEENRLKIMVI